ncbi:glycoside hydrolase family 32 protein [Mucilaginibacter paludis]|nr:glycoside hydrolase family 32 protein [Mucilaginibacter paludis]
MKLFLRLILIATVYFSSRAMGQIHQYQEAYRPQLHFSPGAHWINDPNGMVYIDGSYHLFFQYYPGGTTWGPMHWGHATSKDLVHWKELPIALYPDSLGYIFSGSAVVDSNNTSGFGKDGKYPLVAIFTHHDSKGEKAGTETFQNQSLAYSLDQGQSWTKYAGNPVLKNPGIRDFRDPKVMWYAEQKKWIMTLATKDHITFYSAPDLKNWKKESEFGLTVGAHGGVWECPDLFPLKLNGKTYWVLIVNLNPGGPNGGSATQYFVGHFDGHEFVPVDTRIRWIDYGPDEYAGVTWSNTGSRKLFLGWMSNWNYANEVPTEKWRNAMTIPRELQLRQSDSGILVTSMPAKELYKNAAGMAITLTNVKLNRHLDLSKYTGSLKNQYVLKVNFARIQDCSVHLVSESGDKLTIGFDKAKNRYYIDRTNAGIIDFHKGFAGRFYAPRLTSSKSADLTLVVDKSSIELFADGGLSVMTAIFFPKANLEKLILESQTEVTIQKLQITGLKSIWKN